MENIQCILMEVPWYPEAYKIMRLKHYLHPSMRKTFDGKSQSVFQG